MDHYVQECSIGIYLLSSVHYMNTKKDAKLTANFDSSITN